MTGHSLGGGLSIIFALKAIIDGLFPMKDIEIKVVTFGAPSVVALEKELDALSKQSRAYLDALIRMTHCVVNRFDVVPRLLSSVGVKWLDFVSRTSLQYIKDWKSKITEKVWRF